MNQHWLPPEQLPTAEDQTSRGAKMPTILMDGLPIEASQLECSPVPPDSSATRCYLRIYGHGTDCSRFTGTVDIVFPFGRRLYEGSFRTVCRVCQRDRDESWEFVSDGPVHARSSSNEKPDTKPAVGSITTESVAPFFTDVELQDLAMAAHAVAHTKRNDAEARSGSSVASLAVRHAERLELLAAKCVRMRSRDPSIGPGADHVCDRRGPSVKVVIDAPTCSVCGVPQELD
jgi:hypothetical protein